MRPGRTYHVVPHPRGGWAAIRPDGKRARARAAREARADGTAWELRWFNDRARVPQAWTGARYDVIGRAKEMHRNPGFSGVTIITAAGRTIAGDDIRDLRY